MPPRRGPAEAGLASERSRVGEDADGNGLVAAALLRGSAAAAHLLLAPLPPLIAFLLPDAGTPLHDRFLGAGEQSRSPTYKLARLAEDRPLPPVEPGPRAGTPRRPSRGTGRREPGVGNRDRDPGPGVGTGLRVPGPGPGAGRRASGPGVGLRDSGPGPGAGCRVSGPGIGPGPGRRVRVRASGPGPGVGSGTGTGRGCLPRAGKRSRARSERLSLRFDKKAGTGAPAPRRGRRRPPEAERSEAGKGGEAQDEVLRRGSRAGCIYIAPNIYPRHASRNHPHARRAR